MGGKRKKSDKDDSLIDRSFHVFGDNGVIDRQGIVLARIDPEHYLVQYLEWSTGQASAQQIVSIAEMTSCPKNARGPWQWQFYHDDIHMLDWLERYGQKLVGHNAEKPNQKGSQRRQWQWPRRPEQERPPGAKEKSG